jgi:hypothetical protein
MTPRLVYSDLEADFKAKEDHEANLARPPAGSGGYGGGSDVERRVAFLEKTVEKMDGKLDKLIAGQHASELQLERRLNPIDVKLTAVDLKLDSKASGIDVGEMKGKLADMPSKWFVGTTVFAVLFGASALISAVLVYLEKIRILVGAH